MQGVLHELGLKASEVQEYNACFYWGLTLSDVSAGASWDTGFPGKRKKITMNNPRKKCLLGYSV